MTLLRLQGDHYDEPAAPKMVLRCLSRAEALRDSDTNAHEELVGLVTYELCLALGFGKAQSETMRDAAQFHDIGKFVLPSAVLHKPGRLTGDEWAQVRKHSELGHGILRIEESPFLRLAAMLALCHHEHFDGSGYPRGLAGEAIPLEARIVAVADSYEALRADRAYKRGVDHDGAMTKILKGDDRSRPEQFDPQVLSALARSSGAIAAHYDNRRAALAVQRPEADGAQWA